MSWGTIFAASCAVVLAQFPTGDFFLCSAHGFPEVQRQSEGSVKFPHLSIEEIASVSTATLETRQENQPTDDSAGSIQMVSFQLADEEYGIEITKVQEIILMGEITRVPQTPKFIKGLINLRSTVIPIVDLRQRFGLEERELGDESRIMVINVAGKTIGIIVDAVSEVLRIAHDRIAPPPPTVAGLQREYLTGLAKLDDKLLILLDIDKILVESAQKTSEEAVAV